MKSGDVVRDGRGTRLTASVQRLLSRKRDAEKRRESRHMSCWYCFASDLRLSRSRWYDFIPSFLFGREPYRCRVCHKRQWQRVSAESRMRGESPH